MLEFNDANQDYPVWMAKAWLDGMHNPCYCRLVPKANFDPAQLYLAMRRSRELCFGTFTSDPFSILNDLIEKSNCNVKLVPRSYKDDTKLEDVTRYNRTSGFWSLVDILFKKYNQEDVCVAKSALDLSSQNASKKCDNCGRYFRISESNVKPMYLFDINMRSWKVYRATCPFCGCQEFYSTKDLLSKLNGLFKEVDDDANEKLRVCEETH